MPVDPVVELRGAVCVTGGFPTLAGVDLAVTAGEVCFVSGDNGAGKTSLLRLLAGLTPLASGAGTVLGVDLSTDRRTLRPMVGLLGHGTGMYDELSVLENLRFFASASRLPLDGLDAALDLVALPARVRVLPMVSLSAGQRRRAALAGLVLRRPRLWLLDEPHTGIDGSGRLLVDRLITGAAAAGATVVFASHETERAAAIATRQVEMAGGTVSGPQ